MGRREFMRTAAGESFASTVGGCLQEDEFEPTRAAACSHAPENADRVPYTVDRAVNPGRQVFEGDDEPFAMITAPDQLEERFTQDALSNLRGTTNALDTVDFDENALLFWEEDISTLPKQVELLDVTRPDEETIRAYGCKHQTHEAGGNEARQYRYCICAEVAETPIRAEFVYRWKTSGSEGETTYTDTP